ncbi:SH3 domain-containing protein [Rheinheimera sp. YQF-2]|uniref:SH3 domain-containing protein n=1 Tax=Rheinheimera lutimaris TaxID=2740584 RepID=A0A7Y5AS29_9GAMM|nr:SH3 domain-containing protein [Rheinheimera lutimaris]NRQ43478.1 SH3 domain-containing protein [Rheinheimera lutimaris]
MMDVSRSAFSIFSLSVLIFLITLIFYPITAEAKNCKKGKPCGNSCIAMNKVCRINTYSPPNTLTPAPANDSSVGKYNPSVVRSTHHPATTGTYFVIPVKLNIRNEPSTEGIVLGQAKRGEMVSVFMVSKRWGKINHRVANGWVLMDYLSLQRPNISNE